MAAVQLFRFQMLFNSQREYDSMVRASDTVKGVITYPFKTGYLHCFKSCSIKHYWWSKFKHIPKKLIGLSKKINTSVTKVLYGIL